MAEPERRYATWTGRTDGTVAERGGRHTGEQGEEPTAERRRMALQNVESWVDQAIRQAQRRGDFDDLPGAGKPLKNLERVEDDPDWWVKGLIERERLDLSAALPGALALRRERQGFPESLVHLPDEAAVRAHLTDFNERVLTDRRTPYFGPGSPVVAGRVDVEDMVRAWRELRFERAGTSAEGVEDVAGAVGRPAQTGQSARRRRWWRRRQR